MYPCYEGQLAATRRESFPASWIVAENLLYLASWVLAGWLLWPFQLAGFPVATLGWALLVLVVQVLLKLHNCTGCYYYGKLCHLGWGRLTAALFRQDAGNPTWGMRLTLFYILGPPLILVAALLAGLLREVSWLHWLLLGLYVALNIASFPTRSHGCRVCAMRQVCPGSAAKGQA